MFSSSKVTNQINRCTFKNNIKSHIFIFSVRPVRFLFFASKFEFYLLTQYTTFFFLQRYLYKKKVHFQKLLKSHIFNFYSAPCQIYLSLHQILCFTYSSSFKSVLPSKIPIKEIGALSKII